MKESRITNPVVSGVNRFIVLILLLSSSLHSSAAKAENYTLADSNDTVIGELQLIRAEYNDTLLDIARENGLGYQDIKLVNPDLDTWLPGDDQEILLPVQYIIPQAPRSGIILNIPEMRLYYFSAKKKGAPATVVTYPLGIGREGWDTPYVDTRIIEKKKNPYWRPTLSIRKEHEEKEDPLPRVVKPGPDNPLGNYAMRLGIPEYLIHGTNKPYGIGMRISHGCIRLYPEDIEELYASIDIGTPVHIVNQPYKVGRKDGNIYLEAHPFLAEDMADFDGNLTSVVRMVINLTEERAYDVDWELARQVINDRKGIPILIGKIIRLPAVETVISEIDNNGLELRMDTKLLHGLNSSAD